MSPFSYVSGNPDNLVGGSAANMVDVQGPFYDLKTHLNGHITVTGQVAIAGTIVAGTGFTVSRTAVGVYSVSLTGAALTGATVSLDGATPMVAMVGAFSVSAFEVRTFNMAGAPTDSPFSFVASGQTT